MTTFSEGNLAKKLTDLNSSQQSILTLSLWLIHHRKHSKTIVEVWGKEMKKAHPKRKLTFLYLANDVIQNSKKKGPEFNRDFRLVLPEAYKCAAREVETPAQGSMERLIKIWDERKVFDREFILKLKNAFAKGQKPEPEKPKAKEPENLHDAFDAAKKIGPKTSAGKSEKEPPKKKRKEMSLLEEIEQEMNQETQPRDPPSPDELVKTMGDLENSASSDAAVRERIAALPPEVSEISLLEKLQDKREAEKLSAQVEDARLLLADYNGRLVAELEERKRVARMLKDFIRMQKEQQTDAEQRLQEYKSKLHKVSSVRKELKSHIQSLPDLTLLPDVTGLAPLPSAGDLFSVEKDAHELF